ncbi:MAG: hypothetical protein IK008_05960 [Bacteroidales bacterium]|nr:hypothetical protein [Bacteroidales bacterium]
MQIQEIEKKLSEELVPILGLDSVEDVKPDSALVRDLGAESIDYVEILYMIETVFGVKIKIEELMMASVVDGETPDDGRLTAKMAEKLNRDYDSHQFAAGQTTKDVFNVFTVHNLAVIIHKKLAA